MDNASPENAITKQLRTSLAYYLKNFFPIGNESKIMPTGKPRITLGPITTLNLRIIHSLKDIPISIPKNTYLSHMAIHRLISHLAACRLLSIRSWKRDSSRPTVCFGHLNIATSTCKHEPMLVSGT